MRRILLVIAGTVVLANVVMASTKMLDVQGSAVTGKLPAGKTQVVQLDAADGDYIHGLVQFSRHNKSAGGNAVLQLADSQGHILRQLVKATAGEHEFFFIADKGMQLRIYATTAMEFNIAIKQRIAVQEQRADAPVYLSQQINTIAQHLAQPGAIENFWQSIRQQGTPIVEPLNDKAAVLTFVARGAKEKVLLIGAPADDHQYLERLANTDIWYKSFIVPLSTRLSYKLAIDPPDLPAAANGRWGRLLAVTKADPFNKTPWPVNAVDAYHQESTISLSDAPAQPWSAELHHPEGKLTQHIFASKRLKNSRSISVYQSPHYSVSAASLLLFFFDEKEYLSQVPTPRILDNLVAAGRIPPVTAVFIGNRSSEGRAQELPDNPDFAYFMAKELYPWISRQIGAETPPAKTLLIGSSFGGLAAVTVATRYPEVFGNVAAMSGSFWWHQRESAAESAESDSPLVATFIARQSRLPIRFFISAGLFERSRNGAPGILDTSRHLRDLLTSKDYEFYYREYASGHDYFTWQGVVADALLQLFGNSDH